jgi:hypothetical protein
MLKKVGCGAFSPRSKARSCWDWQASDAAGAGPSCITTQPRVSMSDASVRSDEVDASASAAPGYAAADVLLDRRQAVDLCDLVRVKYPPDCRGVRFHLLCRGRAGYDRGDYRLGE